MSVPRLNRSLLLEAPTRVSDGAGGFTSDWQTLGVLWAEVKAGSGRETAAFAATVSRVPCRITVRAAPHGAASRPTAGQRFRDGARLFHINAVAERDANAQYLLCFAEEEVVS
ncbi:phage head closure protein [Yoonia sp. SS1-5]|uniref:Phage head closure protein n=1 Tax=Yoonia rhodophyticola TaxID=3137370 RepID=A0AAN0MDR2_9RHOB